MALSDTESVEVDATAKRRRRWLPWVLGVGGIVAVSAAVGGWLVAREVNETLAPEYTDIAYRVPEAPRLTAGAGETVYRIEARSSTFGYEVDEKLLGRSAQRVEGTTQGIAGDLALNTDDPSASRLGTIVVDVQQLHSDNNLRDARIRKEYLESAEYPLVKLETLAIDGLPDRIVEGETFDFTIETAATVRDKLVPLTWEASASVREGRLTAAATVETTMSELGVGPISIAGLVSTSDEITLGIELTALDPSVHDIATTIAAPPGVERSGDGPSFARVIQPILSSSCASCHASGEVGAKHWELRTAGDAAAISDGIGTVVEGGYMPPWPASDAGVPLSHSKRLTQEEIDAVVAWSRAGGPLDVDTDTPVVADEPEPGTVPRADVVLKMPEPYTGLGTQSNDYRCFMLDPKITEPTYLTGFAVTPDRREQAHHVQIFHADATQAARAKDFEGKDGRPGWECFGTGSLGAPGRGPDAINEAGGYRRRPNFAIQAGLIAGWVPGQDAVVFPERSGVLMLPGDQLVFQMHYHYADEPLPDQSSVALQLDPASPDIAPIDIVNPLAPVELPCPAGVVDPLCDRTAALEEVERLYGGAGTGTANGLHVLCGTTPSELAARAKGDIGSSECTQTVPESGRIVAVFGHMHTIGRSFRMTLDPGTDSETVLLDIPNWNFNWQMNYGLETPIHVEAGQEIKIECEWDRAAEPNRKPRYIVFAEGTEDEMCFATYAIIPDDY